MSSRKQSERIWGLGTIRAFQSNRGVRVLGMRMAKVLRHLVVTGDMRTAGCDGIMLMVYQGKVGDGFHPSPLLQSGPWGGIWQQHCQTTTVQSARRGQHVAPEGKLGIKRLDDCPNLSYKQLCLVCKKGILFLVYKMERRGGTFQLCNLDLSRFVHDLLSPQPPTTQPRL